MDNNIIRFDWAIKRILRNKANFGILEGLLSELLNEDIKIEGILESESNKQTSVNKMNRVDLLVQNSKQELIIIEVQSDYTRDYLTRMLFGVSKVLIDNMVQGMKYYEIKKIISVNIVYFDLGHGTDYIYEGGTIFKGMNNGDTLTLSKREQDVFKATEIFDIYPKFYILKVNRFNEVAKNTIDEWIDFLKTGNVKEDTKAKGLKEAQIAMNTLKLSKEDMAAYESDLDAWRDNESLMDTKYLDGMDKGIAIGETNKEQYANERAKKERFAFVNNCLKNGMSIKLTATVSGFTEDEVKEISDIENS